MGAEVLPVLMRKIVIGLVVLLGGCSHPAGHPASTVRIEQPAPTVKPCPTGMVC
jgi:PBP1b-binding outer membrane lipoprotein LpoB